MSLCDATAHCELACEPSMKLEVTKMSSNNGTENSLTVYTSILKLNQYSAVMQAVSYVRTRSLNLVLDIMYKLMY